MNKLPRTDSTLPLESQARDDRDKAINKKLVYVPPTVSEIDSVSTITQGGGGNQNDGGPFSYGS